MGNQKKNHAAISNWYCQWHTHTHTHIHSFVRSFICRLIVVTYRPSCFAKAKNSIERKICCLCDFPFGMLVYLAALLCNDDKVLLLLMPLQNAGCWCPPSRSSRQSHSHSQSPCPYLHLHLHLLLILSLHQHIHSFVCVLIHKLNGQPLGTGLCCCALELIALLPRTLSSCRCCVAKATVDKG